MINLIVANSENRVIGKDNKLIWKQREDMLMFMRTTTGKTIVMGRKTYDSMGAKPLKNRRNIVVSRNTDPIEGAEVFRSLDEALKADDEIFVIGGGEIYKQTINQADNIYQTIIHTNIEGDTSFPEIPDGYLLMNKEEHKKDDRNEYDYTFLKWSK